MILPVGLMLNESQVATLVRCLNYGENAISQEEEQDGTAEKLRTDIARIRKQLLNNIVK